MVQKTDYSIYRSRPTLNVVKEWGWTALLSEYVNECVRKISYNTI